MIGAFWSKDYVAGVDALRAALTKCEEETNNVVRAVRRRLDAEERYVAALASTGGPQALAAVCEQEGNVAQRTAHQIRQTVLTPLEKHNAQYSSCARGCVREMHRRANEYQRLKNVAERRQREYYTRCREIEDGVSGTDFRTAIKGLLVSTKPDQSAAKPQPKQELVIAGKEYTKSELREVLQRLLNDVPLRDHRVPLLGTYRSVCSGMEFATSLRRQFSADLAFTERFGQGLVDCGVLKPVGFVLDSKFESTHGRYYQVNMEVVEKEEEGGESKLEPKVSEPNSTGAQSASQAFDLAVRENEVSYLNAVRELDDFRSEMEVMFFDSLQLLAEMQAAHEKLMPELMAQLGRVLKSELQFSCTTDVLAYATGPYVPQVMLFSSFRTKPPVQTFGADIEHSLFFVNTVLEYLRTEQTSTLMWTERESLGEVLKLRKQINTGKPFDGPAVFSFFGASVVVSTLCQFLLELPTSLISFVVYERVRQLYNEGEKSKPGPQLLAKTLAQLPEANCNALEQIVSFLAIEYPPESASDLAASLSFTFMRPSTVPKQEEMHPRLLLRDLILDQSVFALLRERQAQVRASVREEQLAMRKRAVTGAAQRAAAQLP